jgi:GrpB protein
MAGEPRNQEREPHTEEDLAAIWVNGGPPRLTGPVAVVDYDSEWPRLYRREADRITALLGERALLLEHVGSTAVPGLAANRSSTSTSWWPTPRTR